MPVLYIITGSNGAGKSTIGRDFLPENLKEEYIFDGDKLYVQKRNELWRDGMRANKEIRKLANQYTVETFEKLRDNALKNRTNFIYEGHFTEEEQWEAPRLFKAAGYEIHLLFLGLRNPDLSEMRVTNRVKEGGHDIGRLEIEENFYGNLRKLNEHYGWFDSVHILDTSDTDPQLLAMVEEGNPIKCRDDKLCPDWFIKHLPAIFYAVGDPGPED